MTEDDGQEWGGYIPEPADEETLVRPASPAPSVGGPAWMRGPWRIVIALVGVAAIAVGVIEIVSRTGGSGGHTRTSTSTDQALGKSAFIRRADGICAELNPEVETDYRVALADYNNGDTAGAQSEVAKLETAAGRLVDHIKALGPPAQGATQVDALLTEYGQLVADAIADTPESNAAAQALQAQIAAQAKSYGFRVCGVT